MIITREDYNNIISGLDVPVFYQYWYLNMCYDNDWASIYIKHKNGSLAFIPFKIKYLGSHSYIGMPKMTQYAGTVMVIQEGLSKKKQYDTYDYLIEKLLEEINQLDISYYGQRFHPQYCDWLPFLKNHYSYSQRISYFLSSSTDNYSTICNNYSTQVRNKIKNKSGIDVHLIKDPGLAEEYYNLIEESFSKHGKEPKYTKGDFVKLIEKSMSNNCCLLLEARLQSKLLAFSFFLFDKQFMYYYLAGESQNHKECNAPTIMLNQAIEIACKEHLDFDFCGSMIDSLANFYECFGADRKSVLVIEKDNNSTLNETSKIFIKSGF